MPPGAADAVPTDADLPGPGWMAVDEGFAASHEGGSPADLLDCTGPDFPEHAVVASAISPHFLRSPRSLVHGIGIEFLTAEDAQLAALILSARPFAGCQPIWRLNPSTPNSWASTSRRPTTVTG